MAAMIVAVGAAQAPAQCTEQQKLTASDREAGDMFGVSVSVSGDTAVVGAFADDCAAGIRCGSAYVFRFDGTSWVEEQKLTASDASARDHFGISVSVSGDTAVVGAYGDDCAAGTACGSAYVYRFDGTTWVEEQKLTASDAAGQAFFGFSVSVSGDIVVVGAEADNCAAGFGCGSAYVFRFNGTSWVEEQKLTASDAAQLDQFGFSVSVTDHTVVVGAFLDGGVGIAFGSAYVFRFNGTSWVEEQKLPASDEAARDGFGFSVSVSGDTVVVGAIGNACSAGDSCGAAAYVFRFNGSSWDEEQELTAFGVAAGDGFGGSVSVSGHRIVVGASTIGAAYVYRFNGTIWVEGQKLAASEVAAGARFGFRVSLSGDKVVIGASQDNCASGDDCGSAYVFRCEPICGDENVNQGEECDGTNDAACPGACLNNCTCGAFCGDGVCDSGEDACFCSADCGLPPSSELPGSTCSDGLDNDCDGVIDSDDPDCAVPPIPTISAWGMIVVTLLLLVTGKIVFRKTMHVSGSA